MIICFILTLITGFLLTKNLLPSLKNNMLLFAYSTGIGIVIDSVITFILLNLNLLNTISILTSQIIFMSILFIITKKKNIKLFEKQNAQENPKVIFSIFCIVFIIAIIELLLHFIKEPYGSWDAMFIWNFRTKFLHTMLSMNLDWRLIFNPIVEWSHLDYPLLLPLFNLKNQILLGEYNTLLPQITAGIFFLSILFMLMGTIKEITNIKNALIAGIILLTTKAFIWESATQCADIPLSFFILSAFTSLYLYEKHKEKGFIILSFFFAATSAFCKNEGVLFFLIYLILTFKYIKKENIKPIMIACFFPLICLILSKLFLYSKSDLFVGQTIENIISKIFDFERVKIITINYIENIRNMFNLVLLGVFGALTGFRKNDNFKVVNIILGVCLLLAFIGYFIIYLISPNDLEWHLLTSSMRLSVQYSALFIFFIIICFNCCDKRE